MSTEESERMRRWVAVWARAGEALEHVRRQEVYARSGEECWRACRGVNEVCKMLEIAAMAEQQCEEGQ